MFQRILIPFLVHIVTKLTLTLFLSFLCSGKLLASTQTDGSIDTEYMSHAANLGLDSTRRVEKVIGRAHELIGMPYRWGGASVSKGFDCNGLLVYLFRSEAGIHIPRTTNSMLESTAKTISRHHLEIGDAVFFKHNGQSRLNHVGIYIGDNRFIHAPRKGKSIRIDSLSNHYWSKSYFAAKRFH